MTEHEAEVRARAMIALLLLVPAPSLGAAAAMIWMPDTTVGKTLFACSKVWLFAFPLLWLRFVERGSWSLSPMRRGGMAFGVASGFAISAAIAAVYLVAGDSLIDARLMREKIRDVGLGEPAVYIAGAAYWTLINSVLEEYVWRWFVVRQCERVFGRTGPAVVVSAACFTLHHVIALSVYLDPFANAICSGGVFLGGLIWSWMYTRYRSIWPGYVSHAIVDLCIFGIGAHLVFGAA